MIHDLEKCGVELHDGSKICGTIKRCNRDFIVREIVGTDSTVVNLLNATHFTHFEEEPYLVFNMTKNGISSNQAVTEVARQLHVPPRDVTIQGMKDRWAITSQHIAVRSECLLPEPSFEHQSIYLQNVGVANSSFRLGGNVGNSFYIRIRNSHTWPDLDRIRRVPNFFGAQRFGRNCNEQDVGQLLLIGNYAGAAESISFPPAQKKYQDHLLGESDGAYKGTFLDPHILDSTRFSILQWQSFLFNKLLSHYIRSGITLPNTIPLWRPEHQGLYDSVWKPQEKLDSDFVKLAIKSRRRTSFVPQNLNFSVERDDNVVFQFDLPSGSYATVVLGQLYTLIEKKHGG